MNRPPLPIKTGIFADLFSPPILRTTVRTTDFGSALIRTTLTLARPKRLQLRIRNGTGE
jgi:hypothetical protein